MAKKKPKKSEGSQAQANDGSTSVGSLNVGGNVDGNIAIGSNISIVHNYYPVIEKNTKQHEPDYWELKHPYPMPPNFTGRVHERATLTHWLKEDSENRLFILRALGGFGKSALTWHWLTHDVDSNEWKKVVFWSFYEGDASFEHFIEETLKYLKLEVPEGQRPQVDALLKAMGSQKILLIMDGFERALRAYSSMNAAYQGDESPLPEGEGKGEGETDCVNINAEIFLKSVCSLPNITSKVLMTTRLTPRAVKPHGEFMLGCREVELTSMQPADAVEFFHKQGIKGTHAEIEVACAPYGYHPLSLRLLAGRILKDFENPADIFVAQRLKIDGDIIQQKHHVLEVSYNSLPQHEQKLLSTIACFRSPVELKILEAIAKDVEATHESPLQDELHDLIERGLLHFDEKNKKFDLHPIVRRYAYRRLGTSSRIAVHNRLRYYFSKINQFPKNQTLQDLIPIIEQYYHTVQAKEYDEAIELLRDQLIPDPLSQKLGAYQLIIELLNFLFPDGEDKLFIKNKLAQAWVFGILAGSYAVSGQPRRAISLYLASMEIDRKNSDWDAVAFNLEAITEATLVPLGKLNAAEKNLQEMIKFFRGTKNMLGESIGKLEYGRVLVYCGRFKEAEDIFSLLFVVFGRGKHLQPQGIIWFLRALQARMENNPKSSLNAAKKTREFFKKYRQETGIYIEIDLIRAEWLIGAALVAISDSNQLTGKNKRERLTKAEEQLLETLARTRKINLTEMDAPLLLELARLKFVQARQPFNKRRQIKDKLMKESLALSHEALEIAERCEYRLQEAEIYNFLSEWYAEAGLLVVKKSQNKEMMDLAKKFAESAKERAWCDGPPYHYKVAYDKAERLLAYLQSQS